MAQIFNEQRVLGIRLQADGTTMHNGRPTIGITNAGGVVTFVGNKRVLGVNVLGADAAVNNDQPVIGAVLIADGRALYNGSEVLPARAISGAL